MKWLSILLSLIVSLQFACVPKSNLEQNSNVKTVGNGDILAANVPQKTLQINLPQEESEAQALLDSGIKFDFTVNADGITGDGGSYTGHGYISSDGIEISTDVGVYRKVPNAARCFEDDLKLSEEILK